jgi:UDP-glucose 4-epimerase
MKIEGLNIVVTGGAGFIGSNLVDALVEYGNRVTVLDNFSSGKRDNLKQHEGNDRVQIVEGDVRDKSLVRDITKGKNIVYHLAVQCLRVSIKDPEINHEVNATGTLNLCMAGLENKVKRFIYVSSSEAYGTALTVPMSESHPIAPITVYGATKAAGELYALAYCKTYGLAAMVVRPFNTYGPRSHFEGAYGEVIPKFVLRLLNDAEPVIFGDGSQTRDFTYVTDTVKGIVMASSCDGLIGGAVNIARGKEVSVNTLAETIAKKLGKDIKPRHETDRPGDVMRHYADVSKAQKMFGFTASIDIDEGIEKYIHWFTSQGSDYKKLLQQEKVFNWE